VRSALEWARVQALVRDGVSQREIAHRLGVNRRTVGRLAAALEPPRYRRAPAGSQLDRFDEVLRGLVADWPQIKAPRATEVLRGYGYEGSVELVKLRLRALRPSRVRAAQRTAYRPGQVAQFDWAELPTRPRIAGRERRIYALLCALPFSGAQTACFSFDLGAESFLEGHVRAFAWLGGVPRECVYDNLRSAVARREQNAVVWNARFVHLRGHYGFHATACTPQTPREKGAVESAVRYLKSGFWPARRFGSLQELDEQYADWRDRIAHRRRHATGGYIVGERLQAERDALRALPPIPFDPSAGRLVRVPIDGYLKLGGSFYRAPTELVQQRVELRFSRDDVTIVYRGRVVARYARSYEVGRWLPPPLPRPEPPPVVAVAASPTVAAPELSDYAALCA
jgi:transposase